MLPLSHFQWDTADGKNRGMPEGHVLHRLAQRFNTDFTGCALQISSPQGRFESAAKQLSGQALTRAFAHGKHLFLQFGERYIHIHLGLYGKWGFESFEGQVPAAVGQVRLQIIRSGEVASLRGPNRCELVERAEVEEILARLGPDPLHQSEDSCARFCANIRRSSRAIGELVMDQSVVAGPGNIYRAEALFRVGISPFRAGSRTGERRLIRLWDDLAELMSAGVDTGIITTVSPTDRPDPALEYDPEASRFYVYHRTGRPCLVCGTPVKEKRVAGRRLFWCSRCQR